MPIVLRIALWTWRALSRVWVWARPEAVGPDLGAQDAQRPGQRGVVGQPERALDQLEQLAGIDQARAAAGVHGARGARQLRAPGAGAGAGSAKIAISSSACLIASARRASEQLEQVADRRSRRRPRRGARWPACAVALELQDLDLEPLGEGRGPGDVGAAVEVVADPAREGHEPRAELGPALGIELLGDLEHQVVDLVQRAVQVDQRVDRLAVLLGEVERVVGTVLALADRGEARLPARRRRRASSSASSRAARAGRGRARRSDGR